MIFAVLDVSIIMGLNVGETDKVFFTFGPNIWEKPPLMIMQPNLSQG